jgi:M6 family metalloprotease-like protein
MGNWNDVWWPHVSYNGNVEIEGKKLSVYSFLRGQSETFKHEFGHVFGAADYYSYGEAHHDTLMTFDMMSVNTGDHNGFTKWSYGWLGEEDIAFIDRASGGATVELAPIETPMGDGKKIAVIAPSFNSETRFLDEFFLVEYRCVRIDTGLVESLRTYQRIADFVRRIAEHHYDLLSTLRESPEEDREPVP